jgi:hypothetical protein
MRMFKVQGGCHCGNITYIGEFPDELSEYKPRACNCKLCASHGAAYVSDKAGRLTIRIIDQSRLNRYRQGSRIADFLICNRCGVLIGVCYEEQGHVYASINARSADEYEAFAKAVELDLVQATDAERIKRWKGAWFGDVKIVYD